MQKRIKSGKNLARAVLVLGLLVAAVLMVSPVSVAAEQQLTIKNMKVSVWPEYDDPRILVIYQGAFADGASFPSPVKFPVPMGSEINQVCALKQPGDEHLCQLYDTLTETESLAVAYTLPIPTYFLEYYWDGIQGQPNKSFTYKYTAPYAMEKLEIEVQQPLKATDFKLSPAYASVSSDAQGLKYFRYLFNNVAQGQVISIDASYTKPDSKPSVAKKESSGTGGKPNYTIMGIAAGAMAVFFVGFVALKRKPAPARASQVRRVARAQALRQAEQRRTLRQEPPRQTRVEQPKTQPIARQGNAGVFCSQCGTKLEAGDVFCHGCGTKTRKATQ